MTIIEVVLLGVGLAIDASCVCTTSGLIYKPRVLKSLKIALPFAIFQGVMPLIGYFGIGLLPDKLFSYNHIIAFVLLSAIGIKMLIDAIKDCGCEEKVRKNAGLTFKIMMIQAFSTSIDALSVGVTLGNQTVSFMLASVGIIAVVTFLVCFVAVVVGKNIGTRLNSRAEIFGGIVLVIIGVRLLIDGM